MGAHVRLQVGGLGVGFVTLGTGVHHHLLVPPPPPPGLGGRGRPRGLLQLGVVLGVGVGARVVVAIVTWV